jgi:hypothetical protein
MSWGTGVMSPLADGVWKRAVRRPGAVALWTAAFVLFFGSAAVLLGPDASWDLRNYHFYNGFAAHHDRSGLDIFPAQLQTAMFGGLDAAYYPLFAALNGRPQVLAVVLSLPYAAAASLVFVTARLFVGGAPIWRGVVPAAAALVGLTGAATLPTLSSSMSDLVPGLPLLAGLALWLALKKEERTSVVWAAAVGALGGLSVGLKLTQAPFFVGMALAMCAVSLSRAAFAEALMFGVAGVVAFAAVDGAWLLGNLKAYGNPIFPLRNDLFRSDLVAPSPWTDARFFPRTHVMALLYPAYWAFRPTNLVTELSMRDPRILVGCVGSIAVLGIGAIRRLRGPMMWRSQTEALAAFLAIAYLVAVVLWETVWSIYRYLAIEEALSVVVVLAALATIFGRSRAAVSHALFALVGAWMVATTVHPWWDRAQRRSPVAISVVLPPIESDAMALILDSSPLSYVVPFMPETVRAIGVSNNLSHPGSPGRLRSEIEAAVRGHRGPFWGLEDPGAAPGEADLSLKSLGLARGDCALLDSNLELDRTARICRLVRLERQSTPGAGGP